MTPDLRETHSLYIVFIITILVAVLSTVIGIAANMDLGQTLLLTLAAETLTLMAELFFMVRSEIESPEVDFIKGEKSIMRQGIDMKDEAQREILAVWCTIQYGPSLQRYFDELRGKFVMRRLINVKKVGSKNAREHLFEFLGDLKAQSYVVTSTTHDASELLVTDRSQALFLCPHHVTGALHLGLFSTNEHFVSTVIATFEKLEKEGTKLEIPQGADEPVAKAAIEKWMSKVA